MKITESAPLDIAENRGLFIVTPDRRMQLRIVGSVRYLVVYDAKDLHSKNFFNTYEIRTGEENPPAPNYFNGLEQTRLGFEVTRKTTTGDIFVRLETDFAGPTGFRIRHAYGQYRQFLLGQTWSLFSQITALPATVDFWGPTGATAWRVPQVRFSVPGHVFGMNAALGLEYALPDLSIPDTIQIKALHLLPSATARFDQRFAWGYLQLSGILPVLSARDARDEFVVKTGWGLAASTIVNSWATGRWYFQVVGGKAITQFINELRGNGFDVLVNPEGGFVSPLSWGGYITYDHAFGDQFSFNLSYGIVQMQRSPFTVDDVFYRGETIRLNTFWTPVEGAKLGGEAVWGMRSNKNGIDGRVGRTSLLVYYDF